MLKRSWNRIRNWPVVLGFLGLVALAVIIGVFLISWPNSITWLNTLIERVPGQLALAMLGLVTLVVVLVILWKVPQLQTPPELTDLAARANFENEARRTTAQILLGVVVLTGVYFTWQQVSAAQETVLVAQEQQITERFTRAVEHLGNEDSITIRLGGIYALERIAKDSPDKDHWQVMEVLMAYVRENARPRMESLDESPCF